MTYRCDACHAFIGRPWHCNECDDFDLCNGCYVAWSCEDANAAIHNPSHHFTKVSAVRDGKTEANDVKEANDVAATVISAAEECLSFSLTSLSVDTDASIEPILEATEEADADDEVDDSNRDNEQMQALSRASATLSCSERVDQRTAEHIVPVDEQAEEEEKAFGVFQARKRLEAQAAKASTQKVQFTDRDFDLFPGEQASGEVNGFFCSAKCRCNRSQLATRGTQRPLPRNLTKKIEKRNERMKVATSCAREPHGLTPAGSNHADGPLPDCTAGADSYAQYDQVLSLILGDAAGASMAIGNRIKTSRRTKLPKSDLARPVTRFYYQHDDVAIPVNQTMRPLEPLPLINRAGKCRFARRNGG